MHSIKSVGISARVSSPPRQWGEWSGLMERVDEFRASCVVRRSAPASLSCRAGWAREPCTPRAAREPCTAAGGYTGAGAQGVPLACSGSKRERAKRRHAVTPPPSTRRDLIGYLFRTLSTISKRLQNERFNLYISINNRWHAIFFSFKNVNIFWSYVNTANVSLFVISL